MTYTIILTFLSLTTACIWKVSHKQNKSESTDASVVFCISLCHSDKILLIPHRSNKHAIVAQLKIAV